MPTTSKSFEDLILTPPKQPASLQSGFESTFVLETADCRELGAKLYHPGTQDVPLALVLHAGAGIAARRYGSFARFLASRGIAVVTYDYRGIGWSRTEALRGFHAEVEDWSEFDAAAANAWLIERFPRARTIAVAHSLGAMLLLGAPNADALDEFVFVAPHTGYYGDYGRGYRLPMAFLWHVGMPLLTRIFGYFPGRSLGLGEDIPGGVALQWAARRTPTLLHGQRTRDRAAKLLEGAAALTTPTYVICIRDDAFATEQGARRLLEHAPRLATEWVIHEPSDAGIKRIGHFGFFRSAPGASLWPQLVARLLRNAVGGAKK